MFETIASALISALASPAYLVILAAVLTAGIVRGFSGFGSGMIIAPVAAAFESPQFAVVLIIVVDSVPSLPVVIPAMRHAVWREVVPVCLGFLALVGAGLALLKFGDPVALRWIMAATIFAAVALMLAGWRYEGPRGPWISGLVGSLCGVLGGAFAMGGPPAILYWIASPLAATLVRANMMVFLFFTDVVTGAGLYFSGLFTADGVIKGIIAAPVYLAGLLIGTRLFSLASETTYRRIAFAIIILAAALSLPVLDGQLGR